MAKILGFRSKDLALPWLLALAFPSPMTSIASTSHPSDPHAVSDHLPSHSSATLLASTWQVLDQPPPPTLREILGAYRSRGDGDREMLMAMLNAKSAEDQRIASVASLHRSMLEHYQISSKQTQEPPYPPATMPTGSSQQNGAYHASSPPDAPTAHFSYNPNDTPSQRSSTHTRSHLHSHKRYRASESPPSTYRSIPTSYTSSPPQGPPSPYSSHSDSVDQSPRSRDAMAIGSLLTVSARQTSDDVDHSSRKDRVQSRRQ
ncbi:hypothetical protein EDB83DRAFT_2333867 [Lactarius deliciosus]|nr:hypothetical protein EDB83DRAFT_2333867 [Lactarius deliciosus]